MLAVAVPSRIHTDDVRRADNRDVAVSATDDELDDELELDDEDELEEDEDADATLGGDGGPRRACWEE